MESCRIAKGKAGGNPYGFVKFRTVPEAQKAVENLNQATVNNCTLEVKFADSDAGEPKPGNQPSAGNNLYVR